MKILQACALIIVVLLVLFTCMGEGIGSPWPVSAVAMVMAVGGVILLAVHAVRQRQCPVSLVVIAFTAFGVLVVQPKIEWDGAAYYAQAHSLAFDHDLDFGNQQELMPSLAYLTRTSPVGRVAVPFSFGPAAVWLTWLPLFSASDNNATGAEPHYAAMVALTSMTVAAVALMLLLHRIEERGAATLAILASPLPIYIWFQPAYSHAYQFAASALAVWWFMRLREVAKRPTGDVTAASHAALTGLIIGVNFLMRWQSALIAFVFVPLLIEDVLRNRSARRAFVMLTSAVAAFIVCWIPQALVINATWGTPFTLPQITDNFIDLSRPHLLELLFSTWNGFFFYHPVLLLGVVAMLMKFRQREWRFALIGIAAWMVAETYLVSCTLDWHGGGSFGQRRLIGFVPWLAVFLAFQFVAMQSRVTRGALVSLVALLAIINLLHAGAYAHYRIPPSPADITNYVHTKRQKVYGLYNYGPALGDIARGSAYFVKVSLLPTGTSTGEDAP